MQVFSFISKGTPKGPGRPSTIRKNAICICPSIRVPPTSPAVSGQRQTENDNDNLIPVTLLII
jgi:hypothetical protein